MKVSNFKVGEKVLVGGRVGIIYEAQNPYTKEKYPAVRVGRAYNGHLKFYMEGAWGGIRKI